MAQIREDMTLKEFSNTKFIVDFFSWLGALVALFFYASRTELFHWYGTCLTAIVLIFLINRFVLHERKLRRSPGTSIDASDTEKIMRNAILLLPQALVIYYVVALSLFHAPVEKVSWVAIVLSLYIGINVEDLTDRNKPK